MRLVFLLIYQLFLVLSFPGFPLLDKLLFIILYPSTIIWNRLTSSSLKLSWFIDKKPFYFMGLHHNLPLNHIIHHLKYYYNFYRSSDVVVDVGASFGTFPRMVKYLSPQTHVFSVEMVSESFQLLKRNTSGLTGVDLFHTAMGDSTKPVHYSFDPLFPEGGNIGLITCPLTGTSPQTTLDKFTRDLGIQHISLLKIDAEGYEKVILSHAAKALSITDTVIVEVQFHLPHLLSVLTVFNNANFSFNKFGDLNTNPDGSIGSADLIFTKNTK